MRLQDGRTATARDVAAAIQSAREGEDVAPGLWPITRVEVTGELELRVHLSEPTALLLEALTLVRALPTGPYRATEPDDGSLPQFEAHADAGTGVAAFRSVRLRRYDTPRAAVFALLRHEVDVLYDVPSEARAMLAKAGVRSYAHVKPYVVTLGLNHRHQALGRRDVRRALNIAVDRAALVEEEMEGFGIPAADLLWREHWSTPHAGDAEAMRVDRTRADQLLTTAGLPRRLLADGRELPRLRLHVLVVEDTTMARIAARLKRMYAAIGVELVLESMPIPDVMKRMAVGKYEAFLSPLFTGYGLSRAYLAFADHDHQKLAERSYRSAYEAAEALRRAPDDEAFARAVTTLHRVLLDDPPDVPLFWQKAERAVGSRVRVPDDVGVDLLGSLPRWTPVEGS